jgi:hypothetical protein
LDETYWFVKTLIAHELVNVKEKQRETLHSLCIFEENFEVVYGAVFGVKITVNKSLVEEGKGKI